MNKELQKRIKLLNCRANAFIICLGIAAVFLLLGGVCVSDSESRIFGLILLAIAGVNIAIFVYVILAAKNDAKAFEARPCVLCSHTGIKYDDFIKELEDLSNKGKRLSISENLHYFKFKKGLYLTTIIYRTDNFSKREFDNAKKRILRKATKEFKLSHSNYDEYKIYKTIQLNIICLDSMNSEVNSLLSHNANHNLMRVEGLMNVVLVGDKIIIPPIYGDCYETIGRYKKIVNFIVENII
mgnify:FL=1